jgi:hypothetical protein
MDWTRSIGPITVQLPNVWPPRVKLPPVGIALSGGNTGLIMSAAATTSLNVDPGGSDACVTCSSMGWPGAFWSLSRAAVSIGGP